MKLTAEQWQAVSTLLDQALELPPSERGTWLAQVPGMEPEVGEALRQMLEREAEAETAQLLRTLPKRTAGDASAAPARLQAGETVGAYRLLRELGRGGMGTVWLAERIDGLLKRPVALKLPHLSGESGALRERFGRERDILAGLNHPNIARLYDAGLTADGQPFLALEYIEGRSLLQECAARGLGLSQRLELLAQVLEAVKYAHAHLVVHRDLKPSNILVSEDGQVRLLDFGIAKLVADGQAPETELTQLGGRAMTLHYASPEQILGQPITTATDVYSLGVVLYELLCGERPYHPRRDSRGALEEAILSVEPAAPSTLARDRSLARELRGDLDTIALKALKKKPRERYDSAAALAEDLRRHRADLPVLAQPDTRWYRWNRFLARNWIPVSAIAGVFVALVAGIGVALWQAASARQAQARADEVKRFISSIFSDTRPAQGSGGMASAAELLVRASQRVPQEFAADPRVAAELDRIISDGLMDLGEDDKAREQLEQALKRDEAALGERDLLALRVKFALGQAYKRLGLLARAEPLLVEAAAGLRRLGRAGAEDLIDALRTLVFVQYARGGEPGQHLALAREGVAVADRWLAADDPQRLKALSTLVGILRLQARIKEGLAVAQRTADLARQQFGAQRPHENLVYAEMDLADLLGADDRPAEAVALSRQALTDLLALRGADSDEIGYAASMLAQALSLSGHLNEAAEKQRQAIRIIARVRQDPDRDLATFHHFLGQTQLEARRPEQALEQIRIADRMLASLSGEHLTTWWIQERSLDRIEALIYLARGEEAASPLNAIAGQLGEDPLHHWSRVAQLQALRLRLIGQATAAAAAASAALQRARDDFPGPRSSAALKVVQGRALLDTGRAAAARPLLSEALSQYEAAQVSLSPRVADALVGLGQADLALGDAPAALATLKRAHEFWQKFDSNNLWAAEAEYWYGHALLAGGQVDLGRSLIARARARLMRSPFAMHRQLATAS
jgi:serine/threonine protein kinase